VALHRYTEIGVTVEEVGRMGSRLPKGAVPEGIARWRQFSTPPKSLVTHET